MARTDGGWFGETLEGFVGWMVVSLAIVLLAQWRVAPQPVVAPMAQRVRAALIPLLIYASGLVFQVLLGHPIETRAVAFFAMGIPLTIALAAWAQWRQAALAEAAAAAATDATAAADTARWPIAAMTRQADPLADDTVAALVGPWSDLQGAADGPGLQRLTTATACMARWRSNGELSGWQPPEGTDPRVAEALQSYLARGSALPPWADRARIARAEALFMDQGPLSCTLLFCASLPQCYVVPALAEVLHVAGQLEAHTEYRIRQTAAMLFPVMLRGGLTDPAGSGVAQILKVRLTHATIRHLILHGNPSQVSTPVAPGAVLAESAAGSGGFHHSLHQSLIGHGWPLKEGGLPCNQYELAYTLLTFSWVSLQGLRTLGQALMNAIARSLAVPVLRHVPVPLTQSLIGAQAARDIGLGQRAPWPVRLALWLGVRFTQGIDGALRVLWPGFSLSRMFTRVLGYHLLTRLLMDQTRPIGLPTHVLDPMRSAVASWGNDARAPGWMNWLEDRFTTPGAWLPGRSPGQ